MSIITKTDSYKTSQYKQYPPNTKYISSYIEARGGAKESVFFGLQPYLMDVLSKQVTKNDLDELLFIQEHMMGMEPNRAGWEYIIDKHDGFLPLSVWAVPEGIVLPTGMPQVRVENTDPKCAWLVSYIETGMLRAVWYPSTVATHSRNMKKFIANGLNITSDLPEGENGLEFKLHDFGARGASSSESAMLGGMAHLVNFMGSDTIEGVLGAKKYYDCDMAGFSIPASEHSTMTSWGREFELSAFTNMFDNFANKGAIFACVSDSYDIYNAAKNIVGTELKERLINSGSTLVVRPDSGSPTVVPREVLMILADKFGYETNSKGYKVLPPYIRVIQGDGLDAETLPRLISNISEAGFSIDNIAFGMGGGLLQNVGRDDLKYAMKASAISFDGDKWEDVYKDPIHGGKTSKKGRQTTYWSQGIGSGQYMAGTPGVSNDIMVQVFNNGKIVNKYNFETVKHNASL